MTSHCCDDKVTTRPTHDDSLDVTSSSTGSTSSVQLYRSQPAAPVLLGDTVTVVCRVSDRHMLDIVRLVRRPLNDGASHGDVITTNGVLEGRFKVAHSRYKVVEWDELHGVVQLQIKGETNMLTLF